MNKEDMANFLLALSVVALVLVLIYRLSGVNVELNLLKIENAILKENELKKCRLELR